MHWFKDHRDERYAPVTTAKMRRDSKVKARDRARKRILLRNSQGTSSDAELKALWQLTADAKSFSGLVRMLLLTAQRLSKACLMRHDEIRDGVWHIGKTSNREKGMASTLKLSPQAMDIIQAQPIVDGSPYVFLNAAGKPFNAQTAHLNRKSLFKQMKERVPDMQDFTLHDLRRTARSLMSRAQVLREVSERVLGHVQPVLDDTYDQHDYQEEKANALIRLANEIERIVNPPAPNVVQLRQAQ